MKRILLSAVLMVSVSAAWAESAQELNDRGLEQIKSGDYPAAIQTFNAARRLLPQDATLTRNLAMAYNSWGVELAKKAKFGDALERLQAAHGLAPNEKLISTNMAAMRINWAAEMTERKNYDEAENQLKKAAQDGSDDQRREIAKRRAYICFLIAEGLLEKGDRERGEQRLADALKFDPNCAHALLKTADLRYSEGKTDEAIEYWKRAAAIDPGIPGLSDMLHKVSREQSVESNFDQRSSRQFNVSYEGAINEQASRDALQILNRALFQIGRDLRYTAKHPFAVVLYQRDQYDAATVAPTWSAGLYDGKIRVPVRGGDLNELDRRAMARTLRHELTHAIVTDLVSPDKVPSWLNEGLAMYYELDDADRQRRARTDQRQLARMINRGDEVAVLNLPDKFAAISTSDQAERSYLFARNFIYWMADQWRPWKFKDLLGALQDGLTIDEAMKKIYSLTPEEMQKKWLGSIQ